MIKKIKHLSVMSKNKIKKGFLALGPGFITGGADNDPSGIGTYSIAGAQYGPLLLWLVPFQLPLMYAMQVMCARIGLVTDRGLAANMQRFFSKPVLYASILILFITNAVNIGADIAIMAESMHLVCGFHVHMWAVLLSLVIITLQVGISYYTYSRILVVFSLFLFSYLFTALMTVDNWLEIAYYMMVPHIQFDKDFLLVAAGFIGTTLSPYLFFWQTSQEVEEKNDVNTKRKIRKIVRNMPRDTLGGMIFSQLISLCIMVTCYMVLHKNGITSITSAAQAAMALRPLVGRCAYFIFSAGIVGGGLLGIPVLAGSSAYALADLFGRQGSLNDTPKQAPFFYAIIAASTLVGLGINFIGINPMYALLYAAVLNCIASVPFVLFVLILANKKELMGNYKNDSFMNVLGIATFITVAASSGLLILFTLWP